MRRACSHGCTGDCRTRATSERSITAGQATPQPQLSTVKAAVHALVLSAWALALVAVCYVGIGGGALRWYYISPRLFP